MRGVEQIPWLYDLLMAVLERTGLGRWRRWLSDGAGGRLLLDVGCGTGRTLALVDGRVRAVGIDPCQASLRRARRRAPGAWLVAARSEALPFRAGTFDTVTSAFAFCSVGDPRAGLAEIERVLAVGGTLRMLEHVRAARPFHARLQDLVQPAWTCVTGGCHPNRDTEAIVRQAGFEIDPGTRRASGVMRRFVARPRRPAAGTGLDQAS
jgi:ubiquinone/menaquinone biosynthesis C-methylase UbiE